MQGHKVSYAIAHKVPDQARPGDAVVADVGHGMADIMQQAGHLQFQIIRRRFLKLGRALQTMVQLGQAFGFGRWGATHFLEKGLKGLDGGEGFRL